MYASLTGEYNELPTVSFVKVSVIKSNTNMTFVVILNKYTLLFLVRYLISVTLQ